MIHKDWWKPLYFQEKDYNKDNYWEILFGKVTYGMPSWINRCEWIVSGTIEC